MSRPNHIKETRFEYLKRTIAEPNPTNACLIWPFSKNSDGYGLLAWRPQPGLVQNVKAYRLAYYLKNGSWPLPLGRHICKGGGDPACYNPNHIVPGTDQQNMADKVANDRCWHPQGEANPFTTITAEIVTQLRLDSATMRQVDLVRKYGFSRTHVKRILSGKNWGHVPMPPETRQRYNSPTGTDHGGCKLTENDVRQIRTSELQHTELGALYGVSAKTIEGIRAKRKWKHIA
jgi:hypothetical protein